MTHDPSSSSPITRRSWWMLAALVIGCELVGVLGAATTGTGTTTWYLTLVKPSFQPPSWVFGPMWTLLYALMAWAAWRVWLRPAVDAGRTRALTLFAAQLAFNAAWSPIFFGAHEIGLALAILIGLFVLVAATIRAFVGLDRMAAMLLLPYLAWVSFATLLNAAIWKLN